MEALGGCGKPLGDTCTQRDTHQGRFPCRDMTGRAKALPKRGGNLIGKHQQH